MHQEYDEAIQFFTKALDKKEYIINKKIFLARDTILEVDIRLPFILIRFDVMY